jgi:hypothetical protein
MAIENEVTDWGVTLSVHPLPMDKCYSFIQCDIKRLSGGRRPQISFRFPGTRPEINQSDMVLWVSAATNLIRKAKEVAGELHETVSER